jgi:NarL family two-component system response regulator LiaR
MATARRQLEVLIVDGDPLALRALTRALQGDEGLRVVATALDVESALNAAAELQPDVAIVDAWLRGAGGPDVVSSIHRIAPRIAILVLSPQQDDELALQVLRRGATGFLPKEIGADVLPRVVHAVARGEAVLTRTLTTKLVERLREIPMPGPGLRPVRSSLSSREWEVLDLLVADRGTREIAQELGLSPETVRSHVKRLLRKLGAHSRAEAVQQARALLRSDVDTGDVTEPDADPDPEPEADHDPNELEGTGAT